MRLAKLSEYRRLYFTPESAPSMNSLRKKFDEIAGAKMVNGQRYVDLDEFERVTGVRDQFEAKRRELKKNPHLAGLIPGWSG